MTVGNNKFISWDKVAKSRSSFKSPGKTNRQQERDKLELLKQQAEQQGFAIGKEQGFKSYKEQCQEKSDSINKLLSNIDGNLKKLNKEIEGKVIELSMAIAKNIIGYEVVNNSEVINKIIANGITYLPKNVRDIKIYLNPNDMDKVELLRDDIQLIAEDNVTMGGCIIETGNSKIDALLETRIDKIISKFLVETQGE